MEESSSNLLYYFHGVFMWMSWSLIAFFQISTNRYWRDKWRWNKIAHAVLGMIAFALTVTAGFLAIKHAEWKISPSTHAKLGFATFILGLVLMIAGFTANIIRMKVSYPWNTKSVLMIGKVHKYFGWLIVIISQVTVGSGAKNFYNYD